MKKFITIIAVLVGLLATPSVASAYPAYPLAPSGCPVGSTNYSTLATFKTAAETHAATEKPCLAVGSYAGPVTFNRTAADTIHIYGAGTAYGAIIDGGVIHAGGSIIYDSLQIKNTTTGAGTNGDCFSEAAGVTAPVTIQYSKITACNRMAVQMKNCALPPCTTGLGNNFTFTQNRVSDFGNVDQASGIGIVIRTPSSGGAANVTSNDISDGPNDAINVCGFGIRIERNYVHDMTAGAGLHNDVIQNTTTCNPVFGLIVTRIRASNIVGSDAHFALITGAGNNDVTFTSNLLANIGSGSHAIIIGDGTNSINYAGLNGNTIYGSGSVEYKNVANGTLKNNIFRACTDATDMAPWVITGVANTVIASNTGSGIGANCTASGTGAANRDPLFVNAGLGDFHIQDASPERSTASRIGGFDIDDEARPTFGSVDDRGADLNNH